MAMSGEFIAPFRIDIPEADLEDLRRRLTSTRWPDQVPGVGDRYGLHLDRAADLARRWAEDYDWRRNEARLNRIPQFTTTIDTQRIHFLHVRSPEPEAMPLVMTHGWPGSIVEFLGVIGPLSDPAAHGGDARDAFHLVVPALPGFGFSGPTSSPGWDPARVARAWAELMRRLGYERYGAQGGDWGSGVSRQLGIAAPDHVVGVHVNTLTLPREVDSILSPGAQTAGGIEPLSETERRHLESQRAFLRDGAGYGMIQATRPQTLAYALTDSPAGQLAWIAEKFDEWSDPAHRPDPELVLTNISIYWLTRTAGSSARIYHETAHAGGGGRRLEVPTGVAAFPYDIGPPIRRFAERDSNIVHWSEFDEGGHFAAMEVPDLLVGDVRAFFRRFRDPG